ncbi:MAG: hypothetical protein E7319_09280 [Clostridiales bacterium]|nr:hypothetical protein [Clostridiales bacterium]
MAERILLIADADSFWTRRYIENVLAPAGWATVLFPIYGWSGSHADFFAKQGVTVYQDRHTLPVIRHIPRVRMWVRIAANAASLKALGPFHAVHCHYLSTRDLALGHRVARRFSAPLVATFWGSDLLRATAGELRGMRPFLTRCKAISVFNPDHVNRLRTLYGDEVAAKTRVLDFGEVVFPCIDQVHATMDSAAVKSSFGIPADRLTVCIGSSASEAQQQLPALEALMQLDEATLSRLAIVLQHTYCHDDPANEQQVQTLAASLPCQTVVLTEFLNDMESARLRCACDVYLHTIRTDAFSSSLKESLYAGARVAYGGWLSYPTLSELQLDVRRFAAFDQLPGLIHAALDGSWQPLTEDERRRLGGICKWDSLASQWLEMYR